MTPRGLATFGLVVGILTVCSPSTVPAPTTPAISPMTSATSVDPCQSEARLRANIEAFLVGYNAGRSGLADRFFAPAPAFQWYSERPRREDQAAYERSSLEQYLLQRHIDGDQLSLVSIQVSGTRGGIGNFGFVLRRGSQDLESKGAIECSTAKFIVWSIGPEPGPR